MKILFVLLISSSAILYSQQGWITRAPLPNPVTEAVAVSLDGKIYVIGGIEPVHVTTAKVHVLDPVQNIWIQVTPLPEPRHHIAVAASGGKIYVFGGYTGSPNFIAVNNVYEYNPQNNMWTPKTPLPRNIAASCAAEYMGKIYVIGGAGDNLRPSYTYNYVYDPLLNSWDSLAPMPTARDHHAVVLLDTLVYSIGGRDFLNNIGRYDVVEAYSPLSNTWNTKTQLDIGRGGLCAEVMNGKIFVFGGEWFSGSNSGIVPEVEVLDPVTGWWDTITTMPTTRHGLGCAAVGDTIYTIGGGTAPGFSYSDLNEGFIPSEVIGIKNLSETAEIFMLYQNYPNPFNPFTKIKFALPNSSHTEKQVVRLIIYDILGNEIIRLVNGQLKPGTYEVTWNASNYSSGLYFYKLIAENFIASGKMVLIK